MGGLRMVQCGLGVTVLAASLHVGAATTLQSLDDADLGAVAGREGIVVGLELYYNAQKSTNAALDGSGIGGTTTALDGSCAGSNNPCRLGLQLAGREARTLNQVPLGGTGTFSAVGEWLMFKDSYFALKMPDLNLDGSILGGVNGALSAGAAYTGFFDDTRFKSSGGVCLLDSGSGTACTVANVQAQPALRMYQFHGSDGNGTTSYNTTTGVSSGYDDISLSLKIGRMAVEYDIGTCTYTGATACGYNQDARGSFMGIHIRDNNAPFAGIAVGGKMYLFGF